ncbi:MAG: aminodeoxychorismate synthase component I, partial [Bacteroidales bacterium]|nr:aminodeoxychorismate synthase component I [Bacteroidales bacterium]
METARHVQEKMNRLGREKKPFVFLVDFLMMYPRIFPFHDPSGQIKWQTRHFGNCKSLLRKPVLKHWKINPVSQPEYQKGFEIVQRHIRIGDTYLLNYTQPTLVETNLTIEEIFHISNASYKVCLKDRFVCFSPEPFVRIENGKISSFPMKGTIDAGTKHAEELIISNSKELAEHNTIVDLIRNDLSRVAGNVKVEKFRYLERIHTNQKDLWQVSSKITGDLTPDYPAGIGDILFTMLPAGSISGAPKKKTVDIILQA